VAPRDLWQYCRCCLAVLPPARALPPRPRQAPAGPQIFIARWRGPRRPGGSVRTPQRTCTAGPDRSSFRGPGPPRLRALDGRRRHVTRAASHEHIADQRRARVGARSASRWQYCPGSIGSIARGRAEGIVPRSSRAKTVDVRASASRARTPASTQFNGLGSTAARPCRDEIPQRGRHRGADSHSRAGHRSSRP